jgi:3D (Asp-Asp-Asp) domain-containing protein
MRLVETKLTFTAVKLGVLLALLSQIVLPQAASAEFVHEMANSTQKIVGLVSNTPVQPEQVVKLAKLGEFEEQKPDRVMDAVITAYTSTPGQTDDSPFIAASGKRVHDGMIAANGLPFGTQIKIPALYGDKIFLVEDRMNSRYGLGRMDIWLDTTRAEAMKFGVKRVEVEIYYKKKAPKEVAVNKK